MTAPSGLVLVDKPAGLTSHDVVARTRRLAGTRRVGHAGTLDPMATGVLVLGVERATRLLGHLALTDKTYDATIRLGASTVTDDAEGDVVTTTSAAHLQDDEIQAEVAALTGAIEQVPSSVSAIKVDGKRAYAKVRAGDTVELVARPVTVHAFDVRATRRTGDFVDLDVTVDCSTGTYVRALARDLGADLGVGGHLAALRRTRVGPFDLRVVTTLDKLADEPGLSLSMDDAVAKAFPRRDVDARSATALLRGQKLPAAGIEGTYGVFDPAGHAVALAVDEGEAARSVVVLTPA